MQTSKKVILSCISFVLALVFISAIFVEPTLRFETQRIHYDARIRRENAGSYDFIFIGDSDGLTAFDSELFDKKTGLKSMNLSGTDITQGSEYYLLKKEIKRNPIKTVYLQISYDTFVKDPDVSLAEGDARTFQRLDTAGERMEFLIKNVRVDDWLNIYSRLMAGGISFYKEAIKNRGILTYQPPEKNKLPNGSESRIALSEKEAKELYNSTSINLEFREDHKKELKQIINLCKQNGVEIVFVAVPVADAWLWQLDNLDEFEKKAKTFFDENGVEFYDFNLLKNRNELVFENTYFNDYWHASDYGSQVFTDAFALFYLSKQNKQQVERMFCSSYDSIRKQFSYRQFIN